MTHPTPLSFPQFEWFAENVLTEWLGECFTSGEPVPGVPDDYASHTEADTLRLLMYRAANPYPEMSPEQANALAEELAQVKTPNQASRLLEIQDAFATFSIIEEDSWRADIDGLIAALRERTS